MSNLSRKYRPQRFADVYGQERITQTLCREVEQGKLGHAYLFSGPRGVGKTTAARIFAKAVNCLKPDHGEPCLKCDACQKITAGQAIDIIEMDAASHTGVDNVREAIIEHVRFVPAGFKYKVYIVDEAHMLTAQAWNALLKTIEEPPAYAVFIFATTEKHKVPATIVSRCQKFDFMRVAEDRITERLEKIANEEDVKVAPEVLASIAARSEGCLRDAENLLGQLMGLGEKNITVEVSSLVLPPSRLPQAAQLLECAAERDTSKALKSIADFEADGVALMPLFDDLIQAVRRLMLASADSAEKEVLKKGDEGMRILSGLVGKFEHRELVNSSLVLMERRRDAKHGLDPRFAMELALVAMCEGMTTDRPSSNAGQILETAVRPAAKPRVESAPVKPVTTAQEQEARTENQPILTESRPRDAGRATSDESPTSKLEKSPEPQTGRALNCSLDDVLINWQKFLASLEDHKSLLFILKLCKPTEIRGEKLVLSFQYPYHRQTIIGNVKNKQIVENALRAALGQNELVIEGTDHNAAEETGNAKNNSSMGMLIDAFGGQVAT